MGISTDLVRTFPSLSYFQIDGALNETLSDLLCRYCFYRPDRGYIQGMSYLAANLLLYMDALTAFVSFANLLNWRFFDAMLLLDDESIAPRMDLFNQLFEHNAPLLFALFEQACVSPKEYLLDWSIALFTKKLSIAVAARAWDIILLFGEQEIYKVAVAILICIRTELLNTNQDKIRKLLKSLPNKIKEDELISAMKSVKIPKKIKQQMQKLCS